MSESSAPWRALEEPAAGAAAPRPGNDGAVVTTSSLPSAWIIAAAVAATLLMGAAILLVVSGGQGSVAVDGATGQTGAIGTVSAAGSSRPRDPGPSAAAATELVIDVQGAVVRPGIVRLPAGSRVADAIGAAGGYGPRVAAERVGRTLNLAAPLHDGDQVVVPSRDDSVAVGSVAPGGSGTGAASGSGSGANGGPVDLNRATTSELDALPGIGPVTAAKIIAAREEQPFTSLEDLRTRKVLGAATLEKLKDLVVVR